MSKKRELTVRRTFEVDRLAEKNLIAAYEYLVPPKAHRIESWAHKQHLQAQTAKKGKEK